ncbi:MAG: hypothetical protein AAFW87_01775 [Pseudomonadota bacterium]
MPVVTTTIPDSALPQALAEPNRITTEYESFALIPRLGPLAYFKAQRAIWNRLRDLSSTLRLLDLAKRHRATFASLPTIAEKALTPAYNLGFTARIRTQDDARVDLGFSRDAILDSGALLNSFRGLQTETVTALSGKRVVDSSPAAVADRVQAESGQAILQILKSPNAVINRMVQSNRLLDKQGAFRDDILDLDTTEQAKTLLDGMDEVVKPQEGFYESIAETVLQNAIPKAGRQRLGRLGDVVRRDDGFRDRIRKSLAGVVAEHRYFARITSLDDTPIVESREWAFLRREEVQMDFGTPVFRGPVALNSVAPNSELTVSDSFSISDQTIAANAFARGEVRGSNVILANQIKNKLGTLYDYGSNLGQTMSEQGFSRDTSRDEKRSLVEQTISEISEANASRTLSSSSSDATSLREYRTEGKDTLRATSEVSFEAAVPVQITHFLRGLGLVWCPRMENPFLHLRDAIEQHGDKVEADYILENFVVDPREPVPTYDGHTRVSVNTAKVTGDQVDDDDDGKIYEDVVTIRLSEAERAAGYMLSSDVKCEFHQDDSFWTNGFDSDQYRILEPTVHTDDFDPAASITITTRLQVLDEPNGANPDSIWLSVSVTKYKLTDAYKQQLEDYTQAVENVNPARRQAVAAQARRYARLKKEELIARYANNPDELRDFTFVTLMREMFGNTDGHWSYYAGVIKSCIDWGKARMEHEPADPANLVADGLSPYHFLNVRAVRFFLPLHEASEGAFFEVVSNTLDDQWRDLFKTVEDYITRQRDIVDALNDSDDPDDRAQITLDQYSSDLVLGRHLEAVLSQTDFLQS